MMNFCRYLAGCVLAAFCLTCSAGNILPPTISKAFGVTDMTLGDSTTLTFFVGNDNTGFPLTGITVTDVLPSGLVVATPSGLVGSCNGSVVAVEGSNTIKLTGAALSGDSSCNFRVNVTAVGLGQQDNVTGQVDSAETLPGGTAKASVFVNQPQITSAKSFTPATIAAGDTSLLTISLKNNDDEFDANGIDFVDLFPAGMTVAPGAQTNTCGGVLVVTSGQIRMTGGSLGSAATCAIRVPVTAAAAGTLVNTTSSIACSSEFTCSGLPASATLIVTGSPPPPRVPPVITSGPPPPGTVGVFYNFPLTATGSPTPTFTVSGLPPGLLFSAPGTGSTIYGIPTQEGTFPTTVIAANGAQPDAVANYAIVIVNPISITIPEGGTMLPGGATGKPYGPVIFTATGGVPPVTWSACGQPLPPGFTLSASGALAGTPTQAGSFAFDVCVVDSAGTPKKQSFTVVVVTLTTAMTVTAAPNPATAGTPVVVTAQVSGGSIPATGLVQFWVAGTGTKCPSPFVAGAPTDPDATVRTAALDGNGRARLTYSNLRIDDYSVCAKYAGDSLYQPANAGPITLSVIKGVLLPPPAVTLSVPASVAPAAMLAARIVVTGSDGSPIPQGLVRVRVAENEIATAGLANGSAVITVRMPEAGTVRFTADYAGDANYPPASSDDTTVFVTNGTQGGPGSVPIPTLAEWALALMALLLAMLGVRRIRRG